MKKQEQLYSGKAKTLFATEDPDYVIMHFRDDATAFNALKKASLDRKGRVNNQFNAFIMNKLQAAGIPTHFERLLDSHESLVKALTMIPLECVVRNITAGSICKRYGVQEGMELTTPTFEFFLKNDALGDPMVNDSHVLSFGWATQEDINLMKTLTFKVNDVLKKLFRDAGMLLVDYKLEFGRFQGQILLGDEFTPDGCRIWDIETRKKFDKDRFRQDLGEVIEAYEEAATRLGIKII